MDWKLTKSFFRMFCIVRFLKYFKSFKISSLARVFSYYITKIQNFILQTKFSTIPKKQETKKKNFQSKHFFFFFWVLKSFFRNENLNLANRLLEAWKILNICNRHYYKIVFFLKNIELLKCAEVLFGLMAWRELICLD